MEEGGRANLRSSHEFAPFRVTRGREGESVARSGGGVGGLDECANRSGMNKKVAIAERVSSIVEVGSVQVRLYSSTITYTYRAPLKIGSRRPMS